MKNNKRKIKIGKTPAILVFAGLVIGSVYFSIESSSRVSELVQIEEEMKKVSAQNRELMMELVGESSLKGISTKALGAGMQEPEKVVYIAGRDSVDKSLAEAR